MKELASRGGAKREGERERIPSRPRTVGAEPDVELRLMKL